MARELKSLIRLHKWDVDEKRRKLGELLQLLDNLVDEAHKLENEVKNEQAIASASPEEVGFAYGNYAEEAIRRRDRIVASIAKADTEIEVARGELSEAYLVLKKYEIAQDMRLKKEALERSRREQIVLDEIGLQGHRRKRHA